MAGMLSAVWMSFSGIRRSYIFSRAIFPAVFSSLFVQTSPSSLNRATPLVIITPSFFSSTRHALSTTPSSNNLQYPSAYMITMSCHSFALTTCDPGRSGERRRTLLTYNP